MDNLVNFIGAGLAIGLSGVGVAIGQGILGKSAIAAMGRNKKMMSFLLTITILGIALVESAAIYGLIVAFKIIGTSDISLAASIGAGLSIGLAGMGAGIGEGALVAGAIDAIDKNPKLKGRLMTFMVLFVALVESAAIYGLVISFKILGDVPFEGSAYIGMGLSVGLAGLGVSIGEGILAKKSLLMMSKQEKMIGFFLTITILGIALTESAAIYGLVVAFDIFSKGLTIMAAIGAGLAIGLTGLGAGVGEGTLIGGALEGIARNPQIKTKLMTFMVLFVALVEVTAIYGLIIAFKISGSFDNDIDNLIYVGAGLAVGASGLGVAIGGGEFLKESLKTMGRNPALATFILTVSILGIALVESAVIYGLVISFKILSTIGLSGYAAIGAGLAIGITGLGAGVGEGILIKGALRGINADPSNKGKILAFMVLFVALVEVIAIYGLLIAFRVLG